MTIYHRYFRITSGPLMEKAREIEKNREEARKTVLDFCNEIGAENALSFKDGRWTGFKFTKTPDLSIWKQPNSFGAYWPRKNSAQGREMLKRIEELPRFQHVECALEEIGLHPGFPVLIGARNGYCATLTGMTKLGVLFVGVPWRDVSPEELADYKLKNDAGIHFSAEMEHLSWMPSDGMYEIKRWELEKEIEELNFRLRTKERIQGASA